MGFRIQAILATALLLVMGSMATSATAQTKRAVRIGVVTDGPEALDLGVHQLIQNEILALTRDEFDITFPFEKTIVANWSIGEVTSAIDRLLADPEVDLVLANGVFATHVVSRRRVLNKPVVAPFVVSPAVQGLPSKDGSSGVPNLSYINYPHDFVRDFRVFQEIVPFTKMAFLANEMFWEAIPELPISIEALGDEVGIDITMVPVGLTAAGALAGIPDDVEAVYLVPLTRFTDEEFGLLVEGLIERRLPSFSLFGRTDVEKGVLAAIAPQADFQRLARRVAVNVQRILLGEDAGGLPSTIESGERPSINMATARAIEVWPSWGFLTEADRIDDERRDVDRTLSLAQAMLDGVETNLDMAAFRRAVLSSEENVREARSTLLPQINGSTHWTVIDDDRAAASLGAQAERTWEGSATLNQIIYSEPAWANLRVQNHLHAATLEQRTQLELDITRDAANAYLGVLLGKTSERIQKDNLALTRSNLERARIRLQTGVASRAEVYRWESELARSRSAVIDANAQRNRAEIALNRLLHRPLEEAFLTQELGLGDSALISQDPRFVSYFQNPQRFRTFRAFMVEEGEANSPELRELDALIAAQQRALSSSRAAFWVPTVALQAGLASIWSKEGAGSSQIPIPGIPKADDNDWNVTVLATIPIFTGGARRAVSVRAQQDLEQLRIQRDATAERIEQGIRSALHLAGASFAGIQLARDAAEAAQSNLDLVADAYARGAVSIIDLLDAQNATLVANEGSANAIFDFMIDLMDVQRAIGTYAYFVDPAAREAWFGRADAFFTRASSRR